jgi:hypothetical protein
MKLIPQRARIASIILISTGLLAATLAVASIDAGNSTTAQSKNVEYSQVTLSKPVDATLGNVLIAALFVDAGSSAVVTPPDGWTLIKRTGGDNISILSYWKAVGNAEPANYAWSISPQVRAVGGITRYSGVSTGNPVDASAGATGKGTTATAPAVTTTGGNERIVSLFGSDAWLTGQFGTPTGTTKRYDVKNAIIGPAAAAFDKAQVATGTSGTFVSALGGVLKHDWAAQTIALRSFTEASQQSIHLSSASNQYAYIVPSAQSGLDPNGDFSVDFWVKYDSLSTGEVLLSRWDSTTDHGTYLIGMFPSGADKYFEIAIVQNDASEHDFSAKDNDITTGVWYHYSCTYAQSTTRAVLCYRDGNQIISGIMPGDMVSGRADEFDVGSFYLDPSHVSFIDGSMKDLRFWKKALSASQVSELHAHPCAVDTDGLVSWWKFNGNAQDSFGQNNLTEANSPTYTNDAPGICGL